MSVGREAEEGRLRAKGQPGRMALRIAAFTAISAVLAAFVLLSVPMDAHAASVVNSTYSADVPKNVWHGGPYNTKFDIYWSGGSSGICYCKHLARDFVSGNFEWAADANDGEQALLTLGYPTNGGYCYDPDSDEWVYVGEEHARALTQLAFWGVCGDTNLNHLGFIYERDRTITKYMYNAYWKYEKTSFSMLRFNKAIDYDSTEDNPQYMDADPAPELAAVDAGKTYDYLEYNGFKISSDLPTYGLEKSLTVLYNGEVVDSTATTYLYDDDTGRVMIHKSFLKGKQPGEVLIHFEASNLDSATGSTYGIKGTSYQDMMYAPGRPWDETTQGTVSGEKWVAPNWIEIQYKIVNDDIGAIVEASDPDGLGIPTLRQSSKRDDLAKYHIITCARTYSILDEAPGALDVADCLTTSTLGDGLVENQGSGKYYFFTDNWYLDSGCTVKFGPEKSGKRARNTAYVDQSITLYGRWYEAKVDIESDPDWQTPLNIGESVTYRITYLNNNDRIEKVMLFDSPPVNSKVVADSAKIVKRKGGKTLTKYKGSDIDILQGTLSDQRKKDVLSENSLDEAAKSKETSDRIPDGTMAYSVDKDRFEDVG